MLWRSFCWFATIPRAGVRIIGKDGLAGIWVQYGRLKLRVYPLPARGKKAKTVPKAAEERQPKKGASFDFSGLDLGDTFFLILDLLYELREAMRLDTVRVDALIATGDAARTGILLGQIAALTGMITPFLEQNFNIRNYHIAVDGDFREYSSLEAEAALSRPIGGVGACQTLAYPQTAL